ncbi:MAG: hypothetical protein MPI95_01070 [Nitrosopumilus sp.]|nr:hypothetical protein [Nitrosopumilus sp.]CAI9832126.1 conserved hypothetical protein [Nitrosopumilaceae archaeon]MDA7941376.1 hypothetical protein [Nitrosopumilus sp.]MDA7942784.1 hypothetical protein [Nitrosopumilus sp.]MDA7945070.1 hypothetical protein [Nitrosopumilus sp.]
MEGCDHRPVYYGVINVNDSGRTIGSVDVWRCAACKGLFCEEKQLGIEELADKVGMPSIEPGSRWAVAVCRLQKGRDRWRLVKLKESGRVRHECAGGREVHLDVEGHEVRGDGHWSFLVDEHVNKAVEI